MGNYGYVLTGIDTAGKTNDGDKFGARVTDPSGNLVTAQTFSPQTLLTCNSTQIGDIAVS